MSVASLRVERVSPSCRGSTPLQGLPKRYDVNLKELEDAFRHLQRHLHPDKFTTKDEARRCVPPAAAFAALAVGGVPKVPRSQTPSSLSASPQTEQEHSNDQASLVNVAYRTLRSPLGRANYLLKIMGGRPVNTSEETIDDPEVLLVLDEPHKEPKKRLRCGGMFCAPPPPGSGGGAGGGGASA